MRLPPSIPSAPPRRRHAARSLASLAAAGLALGAAQGCSDPTTPPDPAGDEAPAASPAGGPAVPFPDTVTAGRGLPPGGRDSTTRALGGDTLAVSTLAVFPAFAVRPSQVAPGAPTSGAMRVAVRVFGRDTSTSVLRDRFLALAPCPIVLRLHRAPDRSGAPAWRSDAARGALACPAAREYRPGDSNFEWEVPAVLGDSLAAGRYHFAHTVRLADGRALEYAAGSAYLTADPAPPTRDRAAVRLEAASLVAGRAPRELRTTVVVRNTGTRAVQFEHGACALNLRLFRTPARSGAPVWRSEYRGPAGADPKRAGYACAAVLIGTTIPPGDSALFPMHVPLAEVLADSLPAGRYYVVAELELLNDDLPADRWETVYRLDAGAVDLARSPDPLPGSRAVGALTYVATTRLVRGASGNGAPGAADTVRTLVLVTNTGTTPASVSVPRNCPVIVYGYTTAALRDSFPVQRPAWQSAGCALVPHHFTLEPGASWVFAHDAPAADVVGRAGAGRYWFTAWVAGRPDVKLAAGDVELGR